MQAEGRGPRIAVQRDAPYLGQSSHVLRAPQLVANFRQRRLHPYPNMHSRSRGDN